MRMTERKADVILLLAAIVGGLGIVANKMVLLEGFTSFQGVFGRFLVATLAISVFYIKKLLSLTKEDIKGGAILGFFNFMGFAFMVTAMGMTSTSVIACLVAARVLFVPLLSYIIYRKRIEVQTIIACIIVFIGVCVLSIEESFSVDKGALLTLVATLFFSLHIIAIEHFTKKTESVKLSICQNFFIMMFAFLGVICTGAYKITITQNAVWWLLSSGILSTALFYVMLLFAQKHTSATKATLIISTETVFAVIISAFLLHDVIGIRELTGFFLMVLGMVLSEIKIKKPIGE